MSKDIADDSDEDQSNGGVGWFVAFLAATTSVGTLITVFVECTGSSWAFAILCGAAGSPTLMWTALIVWTAIKRSIWRRMRGYQFQVGDIAQVTRGPLSGEHGRVVAIGPFEMSYKIELENTATFATG